MKTLNKTNIYKRVFFPLIAILLMNVACEKEKLDDTKYGSISGQILDANINDDGLQLPVEGAIITTNPASTSVTTDFEGKFSLNDIPTGDVVVTFKKQNYNQSTITVNVREGKNTYIEAQMAKTEYASSINFILHSPEQSAVDQNIEVQLAWNFNSTMSISDTLFDIYLIESDDTSTLIAENVEDTIYDVSGLKYETTYFWQLELKDGDSKLEKGPIWEFKTMPFPDYPFLYAKKDNGIYNIYSKQEDKDSINITEKDISSNWMPKYNTSRSHIAFVSNRTIDPQIYLMKKDGSEVSPITEFPNVGYHNQGEGYCWSPDNQRIVYSHFNKLYSIKYNGTDIQLMATAPSDRHFRKVDWNEYSNKLIVQTMSENIYESEIYLMDPDGTNMTLLVDSLAGREDSPSLSIDGNHFIYTNDIAGFEDDHGRMLDSRIFLQDVAGLEERVDLSTGKADGTNDINPRYSPNGAYIIFENVDNTNQGIRKLMILDLNGGTRTELTEGEMPYWG